MNRSASHGKTSFRNQLFRWTTGIHFLAIGLALLLSLSFMSYYELEHYRQNLEISAKMAGQNLRSALLFGDETFLQENLQNFQLNKPVQQVLVYDHEGILMAKYLRPDFAGVTPPKDLKTGLELENWRLWVIEEIPFEERVLGKIVILVELKHIQDLVVDGLVVILLALIISVLLLFYLGNRMQRELLYPLGRLFRRMEEVEKGRDYNTNLPPENLKEFDRIVTAFNAMIAQIKERDQQLVLQSDSLEEEVQSRTQDLKEAKQDLEVSLEAMKQSREAVEAANLKLKELDQLKSMFIASMSHELRTPLNSIIGFTSLMLEGMSGPLTDKQEEQLGRVNRSGEHLLALITDVIDISKIEAGRIDVYYEDFPLDLLLQEVTDSMSTQIERKGLKLLLSGDQDLHLHTDRHRLQQCLINFVSNALKYSEEGIIEVHTQDLEENCLIEVHDQGIGIDEKDLPKLFEAFERMDSHLKVKAGGTGLGLYLTKKIAHDLLGGNVAVASQLGKGSCFSLRFPKKLQKIDNPSEDTK